MKAIQVDLPDDAFSALRCDPQEMSEEMKIAAAVQWYSEGIVSQGKAAELAGHEGGANARYTTGYLCENQ